MVWSRILQPRKSKLSGGTQRRRFERHPTEAVRCDVGDVLDLSGSGVRLQTATKPPIEVGQIARITLKFSGKVARLQVQARWIKRAGLKRHEIGLKFINTTPKTRAVIDSVARYGFYCDDKIEGEATPRGASKPRVRATLNLPDYYKTLDIPRAASAEVIRKAYHRLAQVYHPDHNDSEEAPDRFMEVKQAYDVLIDAEKREAYDGLLKTS